MQKPSPFVSVRHQRRFREALDRLNFPYQHADVLVNRALDLMRADFQACLQAADQATGLLWTRLDEVDRLKQRLHSEYARETASMLRSGKLLCDDMMIPAVVYGLVSSDEPERVRYVGRTSDPVGRYSQHSSRGAPNVRRWFIEARDGGSVPRMMLVEECDSVIAGERELHWLKHYRAQGMADLNSQVPKECAA